MASTFTTSKGFELPGNGDYVNDWDVPVNADFTAVDNCFGGLTTLNVVSATGTIALTQSQYRPPTIVLAGLLTANVNYQFPANVAGFWFIVNSTTGNFTVTFSSATGAGTTVTVVQGFSTSIVCDGTNVRVGVTVPRSSVLPSFGGNGYFAVPGPVIGTPPLIHQWGVSQTIAAHASANVFLPLPYPNNFWNVNITPRFSGTPSPIQSFAGIAADLNQFTLTNGTATAGTFFWQAIGN